VHALQSGWGRRAVAWSDDVVTTGMTRPGAADDNMHPCAEGARLLRKLRVLGAVLGHVRVIAAAREPWEDKDKEEER